MAGGMAPMSTLPLLSQSCTPWAEGSRPVTMEQRAGEHTGLAQKKLRKYTPSSAMRSMLGVMISGVSRPMAQAPWSSVRMNTMFGSWLMA